LLRQTVEAVMPRQRYEARRKLYLAKLLFDIDHSRSVRDGPRHAALLADLFDRELWQRLNDRPVAHETRDRRLDGPRFVQTDRDAVIAVHHFVEPGALGTSYADLAPRTRYGAAMMLTVAPDAVARAFTYDLLAARLDHTGALVDASRTRARLAVLRGD
jgi:hypothetical protein